MRKFRLINGNGEAYDLTVRRHFFHSPDGLGFEKEVNYRRVGHLHKKVSEYYAQGVITGELWIPDPLAYEKYYEFVEYAAHDLWLYYKPSEREYRCKVNLVEVTKEEKQALGLNIGVTFQQESMWFQSVSDFNDSSEVDEGKVYNYIYDYTYADYAANTVSFNSDSMIESPMKIYIYGLATNPQWSYYHNNILQGTGKINGTIPEGNLLLIDTTEIPYQIKQLDGLLNVVSNMYPASDFSTQRFFHALHGDNRISVAHEGTTPLKVRVEADLLYASV